MEQLAGAFLKSVGQVFIERNQYDNEEKKRMNEYELKVREEFRAAVGTERMGDINDLWLLVMDIRDYISKQENQKLSKKQVNILLGLLKDIDISKSHEKIHPYEVPAFFHYKMLISDLEEMGK